MTLTNLVNSVIRIGDGVQTVFTFPFSAVRAADILVDLVGVTGLRTPMNPLHYVVTVGDTSGSVLIAAPNIVPNLQKIYIYRKTAATQETDISRQTSYDPVVVGAVWDKLTMLIQDALTEIALAVRVGPENDPDAILTLLDSSVASAAQDAADAEAAAIAAAASAVAAATFNPALYLTKADNLAGLNNVDTSLTSGLGFSTYMKDLRSTASKAALQTALDLLGLAYKSSVLFTDVNGAAVRLSSEGYATPTDTEFATTAWVEGFLRSAKITLGTSVATTAGTAIDFTGVPSWARRVTIFLDGVSTSGADPLMLRIGAGAIETTSYNGAGAGVSDGGGVSVNAGTTGFLLEYAGTGLTAAATRFGGYRLERMTGNTWVISGNSANVGNSKMGLSGGSKALSGDLDRLRLTTSGGTHTFDAGAVNITWE